MTHTHTRSIIAARLLFAAAALLSLLVAAPACGAPVDYGTPPSAGGMRFAVDVSAVPSAESAGAIRVQYSVTYDALHFLRYQDGYRARYELTVVIYRGGRQVTGDSWRRTVEVATYEETGARGAAGEEQFEFALPPGDYTVKVEIESVDTRAKGSVERKIRIEAMKEGELALGTVMFEVESEDGGTALNPARVYGEENPEMIVRVPVYGKPGATYELDYRIKDRSGNIKSSVIDTVAQTALMTEHVHKFNVLQLEIGFHILEVTARPLPSGREVSARARFRVVTSPLSWGQDEEKMLAQISYVATREEMEFLNSVPPEERGPVWEEFWKKRDPDPSTEVNEFKEEFLRRLGHANSEFRSIIEGWQTDMGRVYIQHGEPDEVDSQPIGQMLNAWEIWYYYSEHTKFVFEDKEGFGEFVLYEVSRI
jgi:GWxTD domain-containing protein